MTAERDARWQFRWITTRARYRLQQHYWLTRARVLARLRQIRPLPPEPYGVLHIGAARFPVDQMSLQRGALVISGQAMNPFPGRFPADVRTYRLVGQDGVLIKEGKLDVAPFVGLVTTTSMALRVTVQIQLPLSSTLVNETCSDCGGNRMNDHYRVCGLGPGAFGPTARKAIQ